MPGGYVLPTNPQKLIKTSLYVLGWTEAVVLVNKIPLTRLRNIEVSSVLNTGAGAATIEIADPEQYFFNLLRNQDEIEIFFQTNDNPPMGRKVWGGYIDSFNFSINSGNTLTITAKEYTNRLQGVNYSGTATGTSTVVLQSLLNTQQDFTYEGIESFVDTATVIVDSNSPKRLYDTIKQVCDTNKIIYGVNPENRDFWARYQTDISFSIDSIIEGVNGVNMTRESKVDRGSEFFTNQVQVVYGDGTAAPKTGNNVASQNSYGTYSRKVDATDLDAAGAQTFADSFVAERSQPLNPFDMNSTFLPYTTPGDYIYVQSNSLGLDGYHQVMQIKHSWKPGTGITTSTQLNNQYLNPKVFLEDFERRQRQISRQAYS